jgi:hypothetical protein
MTDAPTSDLRWIKFWPADWQRDPAVRMCGLAARGLWIEMICVMHEADPYGHMLVNGRAPTPKQMGALFGVTEREVKAMIAELEEAGVFSRNDDGVIYSRRMVRDEARRVKARTDGKKGGNPQLRITHTHNPESDEGISQGVNPQEAEAEAEAEKKEPPNPHGADAPMGGSGKPQGVKGRGLRANASNPRAATEAEAQREAEARRAAVEDHPLWPAIGGRLGYTEFASWIVPCAIDDQPDHLTIIAPSRFVRDHIRNHWGIAIQRNMPDRRVAIEVAA